MVDSTPPATRGRNPLCARTRSSQCAAAITRIVYTDISPALFGAATRNVFAHLVDLLGRNLVSTESRSLHADARFYAFGSLVFPITKIVTKPSGRHETILLYRGSCSGVAQR